MIRDLLVALSLSLATLPAAAREAAPQIPCELHVWPSDGMRSVRQRAFESSSSSAGILPGVIKRTQEASAEKADARAQDRLAASETPEPMSTAIQVGALKSLPLAEMLGLPGHIVIVHDTALDSRTIRTVKTRYVETAAPCYADLVVDDVFYARAYANGRELQSFFRFRDFGAQAAPVRSFATWVDTKLQIFSIDPPNLGQPALDEIVSAFRTNVTRFSDLLRKRP